MSEEIVSYGWDIRGFSSKKDGFAKAAKSAAKKIDITIYDFKSKSGRYVNLSKNMKRGKQLEEDESCSFLCETLRSDSLLVVDVPIDLQEFGGTLCSPSSLLPTAADYCRVWEVTMRPIDYLLDAQPPIAGLLGAVVLRFRFLLQELNNKPEFHELKLGKSLFETYPLAILKGWVRKDKLGEDSEIALGDNNWSYKGTAKFSERQNEWEPADSETKSKNLAELIENGLGCTWEAEDSFQITHDEFDACICALIGLIKREDNFNDRDSFISELPDNSADTSLHRAFVQDRIEVVKSSALPCGFLLPESDTYDSYSVQLRRERT